MKNKHKLEKNEISVETKKSMRTRIITAVVGICIVLPCIIVGDWVFFALILIVLGLATYEIIKAPQKKFSIFVYIFTYIITYCLTYWVFLKHGLANPSDFWNLAAGFCSTPLFLSTVASVLSFTILLFVSIIDKNFSIADAFYLFSMTLIISIGLQSVLFLRYYPIYTYEGSEVYDVNNPTYKYCISSLLLIYVALTNYMGDTGAYFTGVLFGKHKMNERISPKKTWEGFFGGIVFSMIVGIAFCLILDACGLPIHPALTIKNWYWVVLISGVISIASVLGDFAFSAIKRYYKIKDFSNILPGHGGILDRIDSALFSCLASSILLFFITNGWSFF